MALCCQLPKCKLGRSSWACSSHVAPLIESIANYSQRHTLSYTHYYYTISTQPFQVLNIKKFSKPLDNQNIVYYNIGVSQRWNTSKAHR